MKNSHAGSVTIFFVCVGQERMIFFEPGIGML